MGKIATILIASLALSSGVLQADGRQPGSVLIFPLQRSNAAGFTILSLANTAKTPLTPFSYGGSTNVHFEYYDVQSDPLRPLHSTSCSVFDRLEFLTPADTLSVLAACHNPSWSNGYVIVSAENPSLFRTPWAHNHLIGSALQITPAGATYMISATPFAALPANGLATDLNGNGSLDFDGVEYEKPADYMMIDSFIAATNHELCLVNLTGGVYATNQIYLSVWNDNETPLSTTLTFTCWFSQPLPLISPLFSQAFLSTVANSPQEFDINCDGWGDLETGWVHLESVGVRTGSGQSISNDGAFIGAYVAGPFSALPSGRQLWESSARQP